VGLNWAQLQVAGSIERLLKSDPPLCVVRKSSIHKEQGECGAGDFAGCARKRFEAIPLDLDC
jgi:hypothetical protein